MHDQTSPGRTRVMRAAAAIVTVAGVLGVLVGYPLVLIGVLGTGVGGPAFRGPILEVGVAITGAATILTVAGSVAWRRLR